MTFGVKKKGLEKRRVTIVVDCRIDGMNRIEESNLDMIVHRSI